MDMETRDETRRWELEAWRAPTLQEGDVEIFSEPGRIAFNVDYRSHWFKLVQVRCGWYYLLVQHGGGEERHKLATKPQFVETLACLSSDLRYLTLHNYLNIIHEAQSVARYNAIDEYRKAFVDGRLKKRKMPGRDVCKVWIEPA
jgi:hypothetical protein